MAVASTVLREIRAEIKSRIEALTPNIHASHPFRHVEIDTRNTTTPEERAGADPRLFEVADRQIEIGEYVYSGGGTDALRVKIPVVVSYRSSDTWIDAMVSDYHMIRNDLLQNSSTVDGVQIRTVDDPMQTITIDETTMLMRLDVTALIEVTTS
jgi:hypothetical protein